MYTKEQANLIEKAKERHGKIFPAGKRESFMLCFSRFGKMLCFWYDTPDHSTHVIYEEKEDDETNNKN